MSNKQGKVKETFSNNSFATHLGENLNKICGEEGWTINDNVQRGNAFSIWIAQLWMEWDQSLRFDTDEVVIGGANDLGIDVVLTDEDNRHVTLIQTKCEGYSKNIKNAGKEDCQAFLTRHEFLEDRDNVTKHGSEIAKELLAPYSEFINGGWKISYYYITTGKASESLFAEYKTKNIDLDKGDHKRWPQNLGQWVKVG